MVRSYFEQMDPKSLRPQPRNKHIFGPTESELTPGFLASIKEKGILAPIVCTSKKMICDGHRRCAAAIHHGMSRVPCYVSEYETVEQALEAWETLQKEQRHMTVEQKARLFAEDLKIQEAEEVISSQKKPEIEQAYTNSETPDAAVGRPKKEKNAKERAALAAQKAGFGSRSTAQKAAKVVEEIDKLEADGNTEAAEELRETLNTKNASAAEAKLDKPPKKETEETPKDEAGNDLPKHLVEIFSKRPLFDEVLTCIKLAQKALDELMAEEHDESTFKLNKTQAKNDLKNFKQQVEFSIPHAVCPNCKGSGQHKGGGCVVCKGVGWVVKSVYKSAAEQ